ncbi:MAG: flagellar hook-length control protein FliK [Acidobacteriota bacterium]
MEIRADFLTRALLNLPQTEGDSAGLVKGEVLKGLIVEVKDDGSVVLNLKGMMMEARTEGVALLAGQDLFLLVDDFREGKTYLKVVTPEMLDNLQRDKISSGIEQQLGLKPNQNLVDVGQKLVQHGLPVTRDNIEVLIKGARDLGGVTGKNLETTALALAGGVKTDAKTLSALQQFMSNPVTVKQVLEEAINIIRSGRVQVSEEPAPPPEAAPIHTPTPNQPQDTKPASTQMRQPLAPTEPEQVPAAPANQQEVQIKVSQNTQIQPANTQQTTVTPTQPDNKTASATPQPQAAPVNPQEVPEDNSRPVPLPANTEQTKPTAGQPVPAQVLPETIKSDGMASKVVLINQASIPVQEDPIPPPQSQTVPVRSETSDSTNRPSVQTPPPSDAMSFPVASPGGLVDKMENLLKMLVPLMELKGESKEQIMHTLKQHFAENKEVVKALTVLEDLLRKDPITEKNAANQLLLTRLQTAEREVLGQAAFNSLDRVVGQDNQYSYYYFNLPMTANGQEIPVHLKVYKDGKGKRRLDEMNEVKVAIGLNTQNMGSVVFHVTWRRNEGLALQGVVENEPTRQFLDQNMRSLTQRLEEMGYQVNFHGIKTLPQEERLRPALDKVEPGKVKVLGIDIKV